MTQRKFGISLIIIGLMLLMAVQPALAGGGPKPKDKTHPRCTATLHLPPEVALQLGCTDPLPTDSDGDGLWDWWEMYWFGDLAQSATDDPDNDYMNNYYEMIYDTNPLDIDGDQDSLWDWWELNWFGNLSFSGSDDPDLDACDNYCEMINGTNPLVHD